MNGPSPAKPGPWDDVSAPQPQPPSFAGLVRPGERARWEQVVLLIGLFAGVALLFVLSLLSGIAAR